MGSLPWKFGILAPGPPGKSLNCFKKFKNWFFSHANHTGGFVVQSLVVSDSLGPRGLQHSCVLHCFPELLKLMSIESVMLSNHLVSCRPLLLLPSVFPSIRIFSCELALHIRWPKYWNCSSSISTSNGYSGLISFLIDCFDLLAVQGSEKTVIPADICSLFTELTRQGAA